MGNDFAGKKSSRRAPPASPPPPPLPQLGERENPFAGLRTREDVARLLDSSLRQLHVLLKARPEERRYTQFQITKRTGGYRTISAPRQDLRVLQLKLAAKLNVVYSPRAVAYGFIAGKSILGNADQHRACRHVLNVDLKDFFPNINFGRVRGLFVALKASREAATVLSQICCHQGALPQGAPTSPVLSNMVCMALDRKLLALAKRYQCRYSRYADDLTFSRKSGSFPVELARLDEDDKRAIIGRELRDVIDGCGFSPHPEKTWLYNRLHRQMVTGLVVNQKRNVPRTFVRQLRAMIHAWEKYGVVRAQAEFHAVYYRGQPSKAPLPFDAVVRGKMEFLKMVKGMEDPVYRRLQQRLVRADPSYQSVMERENVLMKHRDVFISHASEDKKELVKPLADALIAEGVTVWYDEYAIRYGDDILLKIDEGLANSKFGVIVLSPHFFAAKKTWTLKEYSALMAAEDVDRSRRIIPVWHQITRADLLKRAPILANRKAMLSKDHSVLELAKLIANEVRLG